MTFYVSNGTFVGGRSYWDRRAMACPLSSPCGLQLSLGGPAFYENALIDDENAF